MMYLIALARTVVDVLLEVARKNIATARLGKDEDVRVEVLAKICKALGCTLNDIVEINIQE